MRPIAILIALAASLAAMPVAAADKRLPASRAEIELSYAPLVARVAPAVVNIYASRVVRQRTVSPFFEDPFFRRFFGDQFTFGPPRERVQNALGSGVIVRPEGLVVTNVHVIERADEIKVVLADRREFDAEIVIADKRTDIAVLRLKPAAERLPYLEFRDSDEVEVGDLVLAIGNPFGVGQTVTSGIVSAVARPARGISDFSFFIQTDAAINPGNSGGALVTMDGKVVGINTAIYSRDGGSSGIGFAVPANMVTTVVESALRGSRVIRPWVGATGQPVDAGIAASMGLRRPLGVIVSSVHPGGPAARAGLKVGDVVIAVNGREIDDPAALRFHVASLKPGGTATLTVQRAGHQVALDFPVELPRETRPRDETQLTGRQPFSGATVANLSPALTEELGLAPAEDGVIVLSVAPRSPAARLGFRPKDTVVKVNGRDIGSVADLRSALSRPSQSWQISIRRDGRVLSITVNA